MTATSRAFRLLIWLILLGAGATTSAQKNQPTKFSAAPPAGTVTEASIRGHMGFLASDAMNGRGSGSTDEWRAAEYIGSEMLSWGIEPMGDNGGFVQKIDTGRISAAAPPMLVAGSLTLTHGREMLVQNINKGAVKGPLFRYTVGKPVPDGAFVFVPDGVTPDNAALAKAAGMLTLETSEQRATWAATGARLPTAAAGGGRGGGAPAPPIVRIVLDRASHAALAGTDDGFMIDFEMTTQPGYTWNAVGRLKGSDPARAAEVILLTAHLDHLGNALTGGRCTPLNTDAGADTICNGADDDASGSTAVLELAEAIAKGPRPKRTVLFAWFGSEESGGYGAKYFLDKPLVPQSSIVANLEFEMIGRSDPAVASKTLWLTGYERSNLGVELAKQGARLVQDPHPDQNFFSRSDNIQLAQAGVIAHTVSSFNLHPQYHHADDDLAHIDFAHMTMAIQSMYVPVMWLTNSTFRPMWYPNCQPLPRPRQGEPTPPPAPPCKANGK